MEFQDLKVEIALEDEENNASHLFDVPVKKYQNSDGDNFVTGFDVTSKEAEARRLKRAQRFGISTKSSESLQEKEPISSNSVDNLPEAKQDAELRSDAILLFGVNEMSTKDVFDYFKDYVPDSIEWIDDMSCVVVWEDENSAKRALVNLGTKYTPTDNNGTNQEEGLENIWRIGNRHPKSKQLLMRYATKLDKKAKGAGSRSLYYLIHGKPNEHKKKAKKRGIVSSSRRRKINADRIRINEELSPSPEVQVLDVDMDEIMDTVGDMDVDEPPIKVIISEDAIGEQVPRGNLYADQEQSSRVRSRLTKPREGSRGLDDVFPSERNELFMDRVPCSAKMDETGDARSRISNNTGISMKDSRFRDLRQKLKQQKQGCNPGFNPKTRPSLSIEVTED